MRAFPVGALVIALVSVSVYLGWTARVLEDMRLSRGLALALLAVMFLGAILPEPLLLPGLAVDIGGALVPAGVALYLLVTAGTRRERVRAGFSALAVAVVLLLMDRTFPLEPGLGLNLDPDPLLSPAMIAAFLGFLLGRSRRSAFVAATLGVVSVDLLAWLENAARGLEGAVVALGGAGVFDATVVAGVLAVALTQMMLGLGDILSRRGLRWNKIVPTAGLLLMLTALAVAATQVTPPPSGKAEVQDRPFSLVDSDGNLLIVTSRVISPGDVFIDSEGNAHQVVLIQGRLARTLPVSPTQSLKMGLGPVAQEDPDTLLDLLRDFLGMDGDNGAPTDPDDNLGLVGIYHTHNAESYVPSDGTHSIYGRGGVHRVGQVLAHELKTRDVPVAHSENLHLPHDRGAYRRSRRTAVELISLQPTLLFDVHRNAAPGWVYAREIQGQPAAAIALVVGAYNPNMGYNQGFARELQALAEEMYPDLIRGILVLNGNYNQDLGPRTLLLEVGAHTNTREAAETSMRFFADVVREYLERLRD